MMKNKIVCILALFLSISCSDKIDISITKKHENGRKSIIEVNQSKMLVMRITYNDSGLEISRELFDDLGLVSIWSPNQNLENLKIHTEYFTSGGIKSIGYMLNGEMHGNWSYFDRKGHLHIERYFNVGNPTGIWIWYNDKDQVSKFEIYDQSKYEGVFTQFYKSGRLKKRFIYKTGRLNGAYTSIYENGLVKIKGQYSNGMQVNTWSWYYKNGQLEKEINFLDGQLNGDWKQFYENGQIKIRAQYLENKRSGQWMWYDESGDHISSIIY